MSNIINRITSRNKLHDHEETDAALIDAARLEPAAFGQLYDRHVQSIYRYLLSRLGNRSEAEDITSQTFLAALEQLNKYQHKGHFPAWLFSIARNKLVDHYRNQQKQIPLDQEHPAKMVSDQVNESIQSDKIDLLRKEIDKLSESEMELLRLRFVAQLRFREIASILGRKEDTVKKTLYRLLARIKSQLEEKNE
ncbi:MAG: RNA polymerase sigma factor [Anaerolineaceae bacterium]|nr:RNA polymerase sigma factor [Anaerolineaceae bacterium]